MQDDLLGEISHRIRYAYLDLLFFVLLRFSRDASAEPAIKIKITINALSIRSCLNMIPARPLTA